MDIRTVERISARDRKYSGLPRACGGVLPGEHHRRVQAGGGIPERGRREDVFLAAGPAISPETARENTGNTF